MSHRLDNMPKRFDKALWDRWLARLNGTNASPHTPRLAAGIADFRARLAKKERTHDDL